MKLCFSFMFMLYTYLDFLVPPVCLLSHCFTHLQLTYLDAGLLGKNLRTSLQPPPQKQNYSLLSPVWPLSIVYCGISGKHDWNHILRLISFTLPSQVPVSLKKGSYIKQIISTCNVSLPGTAP